jgi:hypothetical protein
MSPEQIAETIAAKEGCSCRYVQSVSVTERFKSKLVWTGIVLLFSLNRPPEETCYAWIDPDAKTLVTVLKRPPVSSPETAVRAYIVSREKS